MRVRRGVSLAAGRTVVAAAGAWLSMAAVSACMSGDSNLTRRSSRAWYVGTDSMGAAPANPVAIRVQARPELVENSAAAFSHRQPDVFFTINDSGNDPLLFALDTTGADRGVWRVANALNRDWESASVGPCGSAAVSPASSPNECVYIGDTGDNAGQRPSRVIYRVAEPTARSGGFTGTVIAEALPYHYADGPHDVEAMYVAPNGDTYLITKRRLLDASGRPRPALVFVLPRDAWGRPDTAVAQLVDSLPIIPGSAPLRAISDAALSQDAHTLAVRTYAQVYTFATDSLTGRVRGAIPPGVCNIVAFDVWPGEGITWVGRSTRLLLTSEGRESPMVLIDCPMPRSYP